MKVLHLASWVGRESTGLGRVSTTLMHAQRGIGLDARIWTMDSPEELEFITSTEGLEPSSVRGFSVDGPSRLRYSKDLIKTIQSPEGLAFDVLHQQGIWQATSHAANLWRAAKKGPTLVAPQGSLSPWALDVNKWRKVIASKLYEHRNLHEAACLHALGMDEMQFMRDYGLKNPVAVIPNGISSEWIQATGDGERFRAKHSIPTDKKIFLFLSRITPKKGLPMFLEAMAAVPEASKNWHFIIAGFEEFGHMPEVVSTAERLGPSSNVSFPGPLYAQEKHDAFALADVCVLPSFTEGAPVFVLEALGAGVPVITTTGSPWEALLTHDAGWWPNPNAEELAQAVAAADAKSLEELKEMGARGRALVEKDYSSRGVALKLEQLYLWLLNGGEKPDSVYLS